MASYEDKLALYDALVRSCKGIERKGKTMPYTSSNGYMFSLFNKSGELGIRLPKDVQEQFKLDFNTGIFMSYGAVMKDYVKVPDDMLNDVKTLKPYLELGLKLVNGLKPK